MRKALSSSTAVMASVCMLLAAAANAEQGTTASSAKSSGLNFYITTPQTGERTELAVNSQNPAPARQTATASTTRNTYIPQQQAAQQSQPSRSTRIPAPSAREILNQQQAAISTARPQQSAHNNVYIQQVAHSPMQTSQSGHPTTVIPQQTRQAQQAAQQPTVVASAPVQPAKRGLFSRLTHRHDNTAAQQQQRQTASVNTSAKAQPAYKRSNLSGTNQAGVASWYGGKWHGRKTANGERYNMESMTAAHKTLPFGTMVKVRNERNGRECVVRINNRGPFTKGRIIDLSKAAAREIGMMNSGIARVKIEVLGKS